LKLVVAVIHNRDKNKVIDDLIRNGFKFTIIGSTGGFLREGNTTFLIGIEDTEKGAVLSIIEQNCQTREQIVNVLPPDGTPVGTFVPNPIKVPVGGAVVWIIHVEEMHRY